MFKPNSQRKRLWSDALEVRREWREGGREGGEGGREGGRSRRDCGAIPWRYGGRAGGREGGDRGLSADRDDKYLYCMAAHPFSLPPSLPPSLQDMVSFNLTTTTLRMVDKVGGTSREGGREGGKKEYAS
jgi:ribosomal protein L28